MAINAIATADKLRLEDSGSNVIATFETLNDDTVQVGQVSSKMDVIIPIYGDAYLRFSDPIGSQYTRGSFQVYGSVTELEAVNSLVTSGNVKKVKLLMGGTNFPEKEFLECIVTAVSITRDLKKANFGTGQISFIKV